MKNKKKQIIITLIAIISLVVITVGVTYAFFNYAKTGTTDNTVKTGSITFLYTEVSGVGKGISLTEAYPVADSIGKVQTGEGKVFDFKVTSTIEMNSNIDYQVTARKKSDSTLANNAVKLYLTEDSGTEQELLLSKYSELEQTDKVDSSKYDERILYEATVPANTKNYEKNFKLRMWVSDDTDFTDGSMNDKTFTITVNVYAEGKLVDASENTVYTFDYTGSEQMFNVPITGDYLLETWGASGGNANGYFGGYGGYSRGIIQLNRGDKLYISVGGQGIEDSSDDSLGYNGGGISSPNEVNLGFASSGGGATHIATSSGLLSELNKKKSSILIVSGGGGAANKRGSNYGEGPGGSGGGYIGANGQSFKHFNNYGYGYGTGGTQESGGNLNWIPGTLTSNIFPSASFGKANSYSDNNFSIQSGGGGGFYGGGTGIHGGAGGGSGYIGNTLLYNKFMYCYNCDESSEEFTITFSTTNVSENAISNYAKIGNGYVKITRVSDIEKFIKSINVSSCDIDKNFYPFTTEYTCNVKNNVTDITLSVELFSDKLIVNGLGNKKLSIGENTFEVSVSDAKNNKKVYYIKINREGETYNFDYTGTEQTFLVPNSGRYRLETWGAQGGNVDEYVGGYGGYSRGIVQLNKGDKLYINVGGKGLTSNVGTNGIVNGGYNGGGSAYVIASSCSNTSGSGGGATHISLSSGLLSTLENKLSDILIVSGSGGGAAKRECSASDNAYSFGGSGGGIIGNSSILSTATWNFTPSFGGSQNSGGKGGTINYESGANTATFGVGASTTRTGGYTNSSGGGSGFYGGGNGVFSGSGGGSGYIGNNLLYNKSMYCYNCEESDDKSTKTISTTCTSETATENCSKQGSGYAKITYVGK